MAIAFLKPSGAQRRGDEREGRLLLRGRHRTELEAVPLHRADLHLDARRQVRPDNPRLLIEVQVRFTPLRVVQRLQERVSRRDGAGGDAGRRARSVETPPTRRLRRRRPGPRQALDEAGLTWLTPSENGSAYATRLLFVFRFSFFVLPSLPHTHARERPRGRRAERPHHAGQEVGGFTGQFATATPRLWWKSRGKTPELSAQLRRRAAKPQSPE